MSNHEQLDKLQKQAVETAEKLGHQAKEQYEKLSPKAKEAAEKAAAQAKEIGNKAKGNPLFKKGLAAAVVLGVLYFLYGAIMGSGPSASDVIQAHRDGIIQQAREESNSMRSLTGFFGGSQQAHEDRLAQRIADYEAYEYEVEITDKKELPSGVWVVNAYVTMTAPDGQTSSGDKTYHMREGKKGWRIVND